MSLGIWIIANVRGWDIVECLAILPQPPDPAFSLWYATWYVKPNIFHKCSIGLRSELIVGHSIDTLMLFSRRNSVVMLTAWRRAASYFSNWKNWNPYDSQKAPYDPREMSLCRLWHLSPQELLQGQYACLQLSCPKYMIELSPKPSSFCTVAALYRSPNRFQTWTCLTHRVRRNLDSSVKRTNCCRSNEVEQFT